MSEVKRLASSEAIFTVGELQDVLEPFDPETPISAMYVDYVIDLKNGSSLRFTLAPKFLKRRTESEG